MRNVAIRRCPVCPNIGSQTNQFGAELRNDPNLRVNVVDGDEGDFTVEVDGRRIDGKNGEALWDAPDLAAEIRGAEVASAVWCRQKVRWKGRGNPGPLSFAHLWVRRRRSS